MRDLWSGFDLVEGFQLACAIRALHDLGLLSSMQRPSTTRTLAVKHGVDEGILRGVLEYLAARTDLVQKRGGRFLTTPAYSSEARFQLDLYLGVYGRNATKLGRVLHSRSMAPKLVDYSRQAKAFEAVPGSSLGLLPSIIRQLGLTYLLDLGCGPATLLEELAISDSCFVGWGMDRNLAMCKAARKRIRASGVGGRLRVLHGDCRKLQSVLPARIRSQVKAVIACNVANEMFADGNSQVVSWLRGLRMVFPGRPFLLVDYYGRLGLRRVTLPRPTGLHDYVQLISGQGIPPSDLKAWQRIYAQAGCKPMHIIEDKRTTRFMHLLRL